MKYYTVRDIAEENISGYVYPQCHTFIKGISKKQREAFYSFYDYLNKQECFPPFELKLDGYVFHRRAKLTNFISHVSSNLLLMDDKALNLITQFNIGKYLVIPAYIYIKNVPTKFYFLYIVTPLLEYVDFPKCLFEVYRMGGYDSNLYTGFKDLNALQEFSHNLWISDKEYIYTHPQTIVFNNKFDQSADLFRIPKLTIAYYFISERLKNAIESNGLTGLSFTEEVHIECEK